MRFHTMDFTANLLGFLRLIFTTRGIHIAYARHDSLNGYPLRFLHGSRVRRHSGTDSCL
ncbi:protein of unknown function [Nitrospira japonica]|uniref:Uncharacterized protein n=1 Tax=Nitrospira japonica TaxID=1325564 RepID=A0A1W1I0C4_9BACT|nr:protein of unknown function [Nitrospira japonica]